MKQFSSSIGFASGAVSEDVSECNSKKHWITKPIAFHLLNETSVGGSKFHHTRAHRHYGKMWNFSYFFKKHFVS